MMDSLAGDDELPSLAQPPVHQYKHSSPFKDTMHTGQKDERGNHENFLFEAEMPPPPELEQETVLDPEHRQVLAKLKFVSELIDALTNMAENKANPIAQMIEGGGRRHRRESTSDANRRAEQLVLYVRALHVISSAMAMAQRQVNADTLQPSPAVQNILNHLNEKYHHCLVKLN